MSDIKNLWPEDLLNGSDMILPITILQEQAKFLNEMTKNVVTASIDTRKVNVAIQNSNDTKPGILHTLKIVAPAIGNYDFDLVRLIQEELLPYPLRVFSPLIEDGKFECNNPTELETVLEIVFRNKKTISTIQSLIMQSKQ
ncbi:MAG: hypothetical protein ACX93I_05700 [Winogradskyella sp.]|jgi:hypothetical protein|uniref:Uncharacterized protein n=1 Tax=Winogradskyella marincola TaxID=3037795 RepID=A0ABT6G4K8_9FLAO|nr:hypothetical protein [Winogradskyella sp. YYF002]MDG4716913.1 hypothetical protein [Winogradskyella sp. YYF002]